VRGVTGRDRSLATSCSMTKYGLCSFLATASGNGGSGQGCNNTVPFLRHYPTSGLHYIDYALPQVYIAFVIIGPASADTGMGQHCPKASPVSHYQDKTA
jgi:hypothetical protein